MIGADAVEGAMRSPRLHKEFGANSGDDWVARIEELARRGWIDRTKAQEGTGWVSRLSDSAFDKLNDSIDPIAEWDAAWDGGWRVFAFDLPSSDMKSRQALRRWLRKRRFGRLQGSLWIVHREVGNWVAQMRDLGVDPRLAISITGQIAGGLDPDAIVRRAWDLEEICRRYAEHIAFIDRNVPSSIATGDWLVQEQSLWRAAFEIDPFLPRELWPREFSRRYRAPEAWEKRKQIYRSLAQHID